MKLWGYRCLSTFTFLTKLPIPYNPSMEDENFQRNIIFFPLVGGVLGIIMWFLTKVLSIYLPPEMVALLLLIIYVLLTGGLHLDGVGDSFDGLFSYRDKVRILEIMKDSRIGTNGILGIIFVLAIKFVAFKLLIESSSYAPMILMPLVGRIALVVACYRGKNARENGMGRTYIGAVSNKDFILSFLLATVIAVPVIYKYYHLSFVVGVLLCLSYVIVARNFVYKKIDGITGDILGLICETSEAFFLLVCLF